MQLFSESTSISSVPPSHNRKTVPRRKTLTSLLMCLPARFFFLAHSEENIFPLVLLSKALGWFGQQRKQRVSPSSSRMGKL